MPVKNLLPAIVALCMLCMSMTCVTTHPYTMYYHQQPLPAYDTPDYRPRYLLTYDSMNIYISSGFLHTLGEEYIVTFSSHIVNHHKDSVMVRLPHVELVVADYEIWPQLERADVLYGKRLITYRAADFPDGGEVAYVGSGDSVRFTQYMDQYQYMPFQSFLNNPDTLSGMAIITLPETKYAHKMEFDTVQISIITD